MILYDNDRPAAPDDPPCSCGRPAAKIIPTERWGDVPYCGIADAPDLPSRFEDPRWVARWGSRYSSPSSS